MVDGNGLENRRACKGTEGSNPSLSAKYKHPSFMVGVYILVADKMNSNPRGRELPVAV